MLDQFRINALKLVDIEDLEYPYLMQHEVVDSIPITPETTVEQVADKFREWSRLGYRHEWVLTKDPNVSEGKPFLFNVGSFPRSRDTSSLHS